MAATLPCLVDIRQFMRRRKFMWRCVRILMVLAPGWAYVRFGGISWMQAVFYGVGAAVIGIIAMSAKTNAIPSGIAVTASPTL